jgi:phosphoglycerol transferase MdoB-like AlkP superfamily enzyme
MVHTDSSPDWKTHRLAGVIFALLPILVVGFLLRLVLAVQTWVDLGDGLAVIAAFAWGVIADTVYAGYAIIPLVLYLTIVPQKVFRHRFHRVAIWLLFAVIWWTVLVSATSDLLFWNEFGVRPNFIAVDYLIYTTEVIDNILESYPISTILAAIAAVALLATTVMTTRVSLYRRWLQSETPARSRYAAAAIVLAFPILTTIYISQQRMPEFDNNYVQEIAKNGQYSFFSAFRNNKLDYRKFYLYAKTGEATRRVRELVAEPQTDFAPIGESPLGRTIVATGQERYPNVIQITVESLSADFLGTFGNKDGLTPNLDRLAEESMLFTNFMATGTRTVRGMESLTLSVPPTPGRSIVKRPENADLFNIGSVFWTKGYDISFFYGGRGYFDNMNAFFGNNGFAIHDETSEASEDIEFKNAWGVSDEDLYQWVIADADESARQGKRFYNFVMTTSNHRPFTYPEGRIDIPSHTGRNGAVKYTDYAIGKFIEEARTKPWFDNTIFVIVADHNAGSAGKTDIPVNNYHIPLLIYAPGIVVPQRVDTLSSQIDYAPTLFALLNWSYGSEFYGKNILAMQPRDGRALLGTYQDLGLLKNDSLTVLKPFRKAESYHVDIRSGEQSLAASDNEARLDAIAYYQTAADQYEAYVAGRNDGPRLN